MRRTKFIQAHSSNLACLALSLNGKLLATASDRGTLVRIYATADGSKLQVQHAEATAQKRNIAVAVSSDSFSGTRGRLHGCQGHRSRQLHTVQP